MGRHAAADGAGTDPIVAAALASQPDGAPATRHAPDLVPGTAQGTEGDLGWPGDTTTGGGLGWPGSTDRAPADEEPGTDATARMAAVPAVPGTEADGEPRPPGPRGWRRLFGGTAA